MKENSMNKEETEKLKDLKAVYSGAIQSGEIGIANMIKGGIDFIEKLQKENEELKEELKEENELNKIIKDTKLDELFCRRNGKKVEQAIKLRDELLKLPECKLYGIKKCKKSVVLITKEEVIPVQKVKDKIEELNRKINNGGKTYGRYGCCVVNSENIMKLQNQIEALQELLEGRK